MGAPHIVHGTPPFIGRPQSSKDNATALKFDEFWDFEYNIDRKMRSLSIVLLFDNINFNKLNRRPVREGVLGYD